MLSKSSKLKLDFVHYIGRILNGCQKGLQNITSSYGHHEKNIEFITSGRRPRVINGHHEKNIEFITSGRRPRVINLIFSSDDHNYE